MKNYIILAMIAAMVVSCKKENVVENDPELATIKFAVYQSNNTFSGPLELFPCKDNTVSYFGNYNNNAVTAVNPSCIISNGNISTWGYPLLLPLGTYNIIYWGISNASSYSASRVTPAQLRLGGDMSDLYWSMVPNKDKSTYMPVWDQVMAVKSVEMGATGVSVDLNRVVAGLNVVLQNSNGQPFDPSIVSFEVLVGGIAEKISYTTGAPVNQTKTVSFALTIDPTRSTAQNATVMLYPSAAAPTIRININLANGQTRTYSTNLKNAFEANTAQSVIIMTGDILASDVDGSTFTVEKWNETSQTIDIPVI